MSIQPGPPAFGPPGPWRPGGPQPGPNPGYQQPGYPGFSNPSSGNPYGPSPYPAPNPANPYSAPNPANPYPAPNPANPYPANPYLGFPYAGYPAPLPAQRPAAIAIAATMAVTASVQWICVLSFGWLVATVGAAELSTSGDVDSVIFHMLRRFHLRMIEGLAFPLYGLPLLAVIGGFLILSQRSWTRIALTATGLVTMSWSAWWLRNEIVWWLPPAAYIAFVCLILWTPGAAQWYRRQQT